MLPVGWTQRKAEVLCEGHVGVAVRRGGRVSGASGHPGPRSCCPSRPQAGPRAAPPSLPGPSAPPPPPRKGHLSGHPVPSPWNQPGCGESRCEPFSQVTGDRIWGSETRPVTTPPPRTFIRLAGLFPECSWCLHLPPSYTQLGLSPEVRSSEKLQASGDPGRAMVHSKET